jgi:predicted DNA-binding transcriptional regulator AlpA
MPRDEHSAIAPPMLLSIREVTSLLGRSPRSLARDEKTGKLPAPVRLGTAKRWRREELIAWVRAGCPSRAIWRERHRKPRGA